MALNAKQRIFVAEYLKNKNATQAARVAGYSKKTAHSVGPRLLDNVGVRKAIDAGLQKQIEKAELTAADIIAEIRKLAFADLTTAYRKDGKLKPLHKLPSDVRAALVGVESDEIFAGKGPNRIKIGVTKKIKLADKVRSLEMLAKHFKLLTDVHEHSGKNGEPLAVFHTYQNGSESPPEPEKPETVDETQKPTEGNE